jgi:hypothetical protein
MKRSPRPGNQNLTAARGTAWRRCCSIAASILGVISLAILLTSIVPLSTNAGTGKKKPKLEPGFKSLFDGKDLKGWHKNPAKIHHGTGGQWTIEDGAILGQQDPPGSGNGGILLTDKKFGNFEVIFDVKPTWGMDSGFFLRSTEQGQCYQIMVDYYENGNVGEIYRERLDGMTNRTFMLEGVFSDQLKMTLVGVNAIPAPKNDKGQGGPPFFKLADWPHIWKINDWNTVRARVEGNPPNIVTYINDTLITKYTSEKKFEGILEDRGYLALQVHGGDPGKKQIRYRNIQIKEF